MSHTRRAPRPALVVALAGAALLGACNQDVPTATSTTNLLDASRRFDQATPIAVSAHAVALVPNDVLAVENGVTIFHGGFGSALDQRPGRRELYSLTDRGPNVAGTGNDKLFPVPSFNPQVGRFHFEHGKFVRDEIITLKTASGGARSGLPVGASGCGATGETPRTLDGTLLPFDPNGIDSEGLRVMEDGSFWVSDEYGPFIVHFDRHGRTLEQDSPCSGPHPLPAVLIKRQANKGMEGLAALAGGRVLVGIIQNPVDNPNHAAAKASHLLRIVMLDLRTGSIRQYLYPMDDPGYGASEIEAVSPTRFLVDERDGKFFNDPAGPSVQKKIYLIDIAGATDVNDPSNGANGLMIGGKTLEQLNDSALAANGIVPVKKTLVVDMLAFGYPHDKAEGMVLLDDGRTIAVSNDDDFGVTDDGKGHFIQKLLPSGAVDHNEVWFFRLNRSLHDLH